MLYDDQFLTRLADGLATLLPVWGVGQEAELRLLTISENATYLVSDPAGRDLVIRVHRPDYHSEAEILSELAWTEALRRDRIVVTPHVVPAEDGRLLHAFSDGGTQRFAVAFEFMSGREPDAESDLVRWYGVLGGVNARLHDHSRNWKRPQDFVRKIWDFEHILGPSAWWGDWRAALGLTAEGRAVLERVHDELERRTAAFGYDQDRFGLVHCDMRTANLLVEGERLGVIDFDDCGFSWFAYDFAAAISFMEHEPFVPDLTAAWLEGYRRVSPLDAGQEAALPMFVMLRRMQLTAWIASHAETPTARALGTGYTDGTVALGERFLASL
ncbi:phosphotransferase [Rhizobiaceae bacterium BDR2-2]|uniref:Phosphotransferase n=1 Tax=Ectorhizobium quercum TaxID=2965071 RepID=A0AAE3N0W7_9HYPH|nr:phosphotransferase [Ectorhizobium quercum]MCX8998111.1 phosphotransferase [Ectorhizobium quercum]